MARQWVKWELKKDPLKEAAFWIEKMFRERREKVFTFIISFAVLCFLGLLIYRAHRKNVESSYALLIQAENVLYSDPDMALTFTDQVFAKKPDKKISALASYIKGNALFLKEDWTGAISSYEQALASPYLEPLALYAQSKSWEASGNLQKAAEGYQNFISKFDRHFLAPEVYISFARILKKSGYAEEAGKYLEMIKARFQGTKWAEYAERLSGEK